MLHVESLFTNLDGISSPKNNKSPPIFFPPNLFLFELIFKWSTIILSGHWTSFLQVQFLYQEYRCVQYDRMSSESFYSEY